MTGYTFNQLFDFTRTTSGTFVGSNGLIQNTPASVNLLTWTQQFDNGFYLQDDISIVANSTTAPDGTTTADTIFDTATNSDHRLIANNSFTTVSGQSYTLSFFIKNLNRNFAQIAFATSGFSSTAYANFDLSTGVLGTVGAGTTATITAAGNGWYRCSITATASSSALTGLFVSLITSATAVRAELYAGTGQSIYIWGAQLEAASAATTYTRNNGGVFPPRFDYDPVTLAPKGLLVEEQRTNLALRSEEFDNAAWQKQAGVSVTGVNVGVAPSGTTTADEVTFTATTNDSIYQSITVLATTAYTFSIWVKGSGGQVLQVSCQPPAAGAVFTQVTLNGQWQRVTATATTVGAGAMNVAVDLVSGTTPAIVQLWGAQVEAGAFATSYIPTVASQVTRTADQCSIVAPNFAPWYNQSEGTWVAQFSGNGSYAAVANDGTTSNYNGVAYSGTSNIAGITTNAGTARTVAMTAGAAGTVNRTAYAYKVNDLAGSTNGGAVATNATAVIPTNLIQLIVGSYGGFGFLNGHIRSIRYYPFRASNNQLQVLST